MRFAAWWCLLVLAACGGPKQESKTQAPRVRITQFYSPTPSIPKGEKGKLCYGVENAKSVRLEPPDADVSPAFVRCVEVDPKSDTKYTLMAEGSDGTVDKQTVEVRRGGARLGIKEISVNSTSVRAGELVRVCVTAPGAVVFEGSPGRVMPGRSAAKGCLEDHPRTTTTYHVAVRGEGGDSDEGDVTVKVK